MRLSLLKKWLFGAVLFLLLASLITYIWVEYQMTQRAGGHTQVIERGQFSPTSGPILIKNVSLLSADGLTMLPAQLILLDKGKIAQINPPQERLDSLLNNPLIVDGSNKYLIPGLVDSHAHLGVFQGSWHSLLKFYATLFVSLSGTLSGFNITAPMGSQFLIPLGQRFGFLSFATSSTAFR